MRRHLTPRACCLIGLTLFGLANPTQAASEQWKDTQGNSFRAEPVESLGPLALFRTSRNAGRMLAWKYLAPAVCVRFYERTRHKPVRAGDWAQARGVLSLEMAGKVSRVRGEELVPAGLKDRPEPEFFILFFANHGIGKSWEMLGHSIGPFNQLQQAYPGQVEGLYYGMWHSPAEHRNMAVSMKLPWLVADFGDERRLATITEFAPRVIGRHTAWS